jgi:hypothetical protein
MIMPRAAGWALEPVPDPGRVPLDVTWGLTAQRNVSASRFVAWPRPEAAGCSKLRTSSSNPPEASYFALETWRQAMGPCDQDAFSPPNIAQTFKPNTVDVAGQRAGA